MSSDEVFGPLVSGDEIKSELRTRSQKVDYKTVTGKNMKLILDKVKLEEVDGWRKKKRNKKSYKLERDKALDVQLEDEVWCILANMKFSQLSQGRQFKVSIKSAPNPRQIDVFAVDDDVALVVECTQSDKPKRKDMSKLIDKISAFKGEISNSIHKQLNGEKQRKTKFVIATRNIEWRPVDVTKCENAGIAILTETELEYYAKLTQFMKSAARFQLLAHLFEGVGIPGLAHEVSATQVITGKTKYYNFLISPADLIKISYVGHKASRSTDNIDTYQRMLQPNRLKKISKFINDGGRFPTNIVLNFKTPRKRALKFEKTGEVGGVSTGKLTLPTNYGSAWVIDGQHRLYGYAYAQQEEGYKEDQSVLSVLAYENLESKDEMDMFVDINSKQVKVKTNLLIELYADLHWNSDDQSEKMLAVRARIVSKLNTLKTSPIYDRVAVTGKGKTYLRCLTQQSLSDGIKEAGLLGSIKKDEYIPGPLAHHAGNDASKTLGKAVDVIKEILNMFAEEVPDNWNAGDKSGIGYLCTNIGIRSLLLVLESACHYVRHKISIDLSTLTADELLEELKSVFRPLVEYFKSADIDTIQTFRRKGSSLAAVSNQAMGMNAIINEKIPDYIPKGLTEYLATRDKNANEESLLMINKVHTKMFEFVIGMLKREFTEENKVWWVEGIPKATRIKCTNAWEEKNRQGEEEEELNLSDYVHIASANWEIFKHYFALGAKNIDDKKKVMKWIDDLIRLRNKTSHPERGLLNAKEASRVKEIYDLVDEYFVIPE